MCLIAFAWNAHPRYPLILVANRDEFHARPTAPLAPWDDAPDVLGGRDLKEGGGWLAMNRSRPRLAAVTNVREPHAVDAPRSRGALVRSYLTGKDNAVSFAETVRVIGNEYGAFNLLLWDGEDLIYATNRLKPHWETVPPGVYGLSNGGFDAPWPKTCKLTATLRGWIEATATETDAAPDILHVMQPLFTALADETIAADAQLPNTGVGIELERRLSPVFIRGSIYGTRAASIVLIDRHGHALIVERSYGADGVLGETRQATSLHGLDHGARS
jgi:uncharacterized protein with NRDE domain